MNNEIIYIRNQNLKLALTFLLSGIVITVILVRTITQPLLKLVDGTKAVSRGKLNTKITIDTKDELGLLANSFNRMTENLLKSNNEIVAAKEYTDNIISSMKDSLIVISPEGTIEIINHATSTLLGYTDEELIGEPIKKIIAENSWFSNLPLDDKIDKRFMDEKEIFFVTKDGRDVPVLFSVSKIPNVNNKTQAVVLVARDITDIKLSEERIQRSLIEKEVLLKEIHHRVKNNLQVVSSLLFHQSQYADDKTKDLFTESQNRVKSMALIHENLYASDNLSKIDFEKYIKGLIIHLNTTYKNSSNNSIDINTGIQNIL